MSDDRSSSQVNPPQPVDSYVPPPLNQPAPMVNEQDIVNPFPNQTDFPPAPAPFTPSGPSYETEPAALKPLLNPLQTYDTPPQSTHVEPPRSPNPANEATDDKGDNVELDLPSGSASVVGPGDEILLQPEPETVPEPVISAASVDGEASLAPPPMNTGRSASPSPSPVPPPRIDTPSSLPRDAPMPPTPDPKDEYPQPSMTDIADIVHEDVPAPATDVVAPAAPVPEEVPEYRQPVEQPFEEDEPPVLPPIEPNAEPASSAPTEPPTAPATASDPPLLPLPSTENDMEVDAAPSAMETSIAPPAAPELPPQPLPPSETPIAEPVPTPVVEPSAPVSDVMDIDQPPEPVSERPKLETRDSSSALKRAGEEIAGGDEKRAKEEPDASAMAPEASTQVQVSEPAPVPTIALPQGAPPPAWTNYVPPAPRPSGPTTPLTITQHKHLLNTVRGMKKVKDAINFIKPVDIVLFGIPHYAQIIEKPMDLGTVEQKLLVSDPRGPPKDKSKMEKWDESMGNYSNVSEVVEDVRQIWENTRKFNGADHLVSQQATRLETSFEKALNSLPAEPAAAPPPKAPTPVPVPSPTAGPSSHTRRPSVSQAPTIRRSEEGPDAVRPKREIHPPPSKDIAYADAGRKPKRRNDPQLQYALRTLKGFEATNKHFTMVSPFLFSIEKIIETFPNYTSIIKQPIDLNQIKAKLEEGDYDEVSQTDSDIKLMIKNAMTFNPPGDPVHDAAQQLKQAWEEKLRAMPAKQEVRDLSDSPAADVWEHEESDAEDTANLRKLENQVNDLQSQIAEIKARQVKRRATKPAKGSKKKSAARKPSMSKTSPGANGHAPKKPRKSKETIYRDDEEGGSDGEVQSLTISQKEELAQKIGYADPVTLDKAVELIKKTTQLEGKDGEIELDIDALPARTLIQLYSLVCLSGRPMAKPKGAGKKAGKAGGARKNMNEQDEEDRIRRMQAQLDSFGSGRAGGGGYGNAEDSESSDEEDSDEE